MADVRAITVRHPWAWCMVYPADPKDTENRGRAFPKGYSGPLLVHSARTWSERGETDPRVLAVLPDKAIDRGNLLVPRSATPHWAGFTFGAIIGVTYLEDAHPEHGHCCEPWGEHEYQAADGSRTTEVTHLRLAPARPLPEPVPCRGALGLWTPPPDVVAAVTAQALTPRPLPRP